MPIPYRLSRKAPKPLRDEFRTVKNFQAIADRRGVNVRYVYELLVKGIIPSNPTIAQKLGVEYYTRAKLRLGDARHRHIRWWNHLTPDQRNQLIFFLYHYKEGEREAR